MTDEIVGRLRAFDNGYVGTHYNNCWHSHHVCALLFAADKIEQLQQAGDRLAEGVRTGHWDDALDTWNEARHG